METTVVKLAHTWKNRPEVASILAGIKSLPDFLSNLREVAHGLVFTDEGGTLRGENDRSQMLGDGKICMRAIRN